jgi:hypothetical protein
MPAQLNLKALSGRQQKALHITILCHSSSLPGKQTEYFWALLCFITHSLSGSAPFFVIFSQIARFSQNTLVFNTDDCFNIFRNCKLESFSNREALSKKSSCEFLGSHVKCLMFCLVLIKFQLPRYILVKIPSV